MKTVEPKVEFISVEESAVLKALEDRDPANPIAVEVARLILGYTENIQELVQRLGHFPPDLLRLKPSSPIEAVAMRLTSDSIRESLGGKTH